MVYICTKFGIANYDEYSLVWDLDADDNSSTKTATLRRVSVSVVMNGSTAASASPFSSVQDRSLQRPDKKMDELRKKCHTDDDSEFTLDGHEFVLLTPESFLVLWLDQSKTLRQQDIDDHATVILRRKYFFSDTNIDQRDPVQLNLLYVQVGLDDWMPLHRVFFSLLFYH